MTTTTTAAPKQRKPRPKPQRFVGLLIRPGKNQTGVLRLTVGGKAQDYFLTPLPSDFGRGFRLVKVGIDVPFGECEYAVNVNGTESSCECKGHLRHGHCKHVDSLAALVARNLL